jgi:hypothetical protein
MEVAIREVVLVRAEWDLRIDASAQSLNSNLPKASSPRDCHASMTLAKMALA